eukprot:5037391-Pyramimonas_sp.AAC.1
MTAPHREAQYLSWRPKTVSLDMPRRSRDDLLLRGCYGTAELDLDFAFGEAYGWASHPPSSFVGFD